MGTIGKLLSDFCVWCSAAGLPHCGNAPNISLRLFWLVVFLACGAACGWIIWILPWNQFVNQETSVERKFVSDSLAFPTISICNMNPYKRSQLTNTTSIGPFLTEYVSKISSSDKNYTDFRNTYNISYDFNSDYPVSTIVEMEARDILIYKAAAEKADSRDRLLYDVWDLIGECTFNNEDCDLQSYFEPVNDPMFGRCLVFNANGSRTFQQPGAQFGLRMLITVDQSEYLPITSSAGVIITIEGQNTSMFPDSFGYQSSVGFSTSFQLKYQETDSISLGTDDHNCTDDASQPFYYNGSYNVEACLRSCWQERIMQKCNCVTPKYQPFSGSAYRQCNVSDRICIKSVNHSATDCNCQPRCTQKQYFVTVSQAIWPPSHFVPGNCTYWNSSWSNQSDCFDWYSRNGLFVEIYYPQSDYEALTETLSYELVNLLSDIGGQAGMWTGLSVITVVEILYIIGIFFTLCGHRVSKSAGLLDGGKKVQPSPPAPARPNIYGYPVPRPVVWPVNRFGSKPAMPQT